MKKTTLKSVSRTGRLFKEGMLKGNVSALATRSQWKVIFLRKDSISTSREKAVNFFIGNSAARQRIPLLKKRSPPPKRKRAPI